MTNVMTYENEFKPMRLEHTGEMPRRFKMAAAALKNLKHFYGEGAIDTQHEVPVVADRAGLIVKYMDPSHVALFKMLVGQDPRRSHKPMHRLPVESIAKSIIWDAPNITMSVDISEANVNNRVLKAESSDGRSHQWTLHEDPLNEAPEPRLRNWPDVETTFKVKDIIAEIRKARKRNKGSLDYLGFSENSITQYEKGKEGSWYNFEVLYRVLNPLAKWKDEITLEFSHNKPMRVVWDNDAYIIATAWFAPLIPEGTA